MQLTYSHTRKACYMGYITQAIINNLLPLLFIVFQADYGLSYAMLGGLITVNFGVQLVVDALAVKFADRIGYRIPLVLAHVMSVLGLVMLAVLPRVLPSVYVGLLCSVIVYAVGGGLLEVLVSPVVDSLPTPKEQKAASMSFLHSFYCWGQVAVVLFTTLLLRVFGMANWWTMPLLWAVVPLINLYVFTRVPLAPTLPQEQRTPLRKLFTQPAFVAALLLMICAGSSELTVSQWSSLFAERGLGLSKVWGDLAGPCVFAVLMGAGRILYGIWGNRIRLRPYMLICTALCVASYMMTSLSGLPLISLIGCAVCGFAVSIMWPGTFSLAAARFPAGGTAMFAILALCGDLGASAGPWAAGAVADSVTTPGGLASFAQALFSGQVAGLRAGIFVGALFPVAMLLTLLFWNRQKDV